MRRVSAFTRPLTFNSIALVSSRQQQWALLLPHQSAPLSTTTSSPTRKRPLPTTPLVCQPNSPHINNKPWVPGSRARLPELPLVFGSWSDPFVVIYKPAGLPVASTNRDSVEARIKEAVGHDNVYLVHRLDKHTAGVMVIALEASTASRLQSSIAMHSRTNVSDSATSSSTSSSSSLNKQQSPPHARPGSDAPKSARLVRREERARHVATTTPWTKRYRVLVDLPPCVHKQVLTEAARDTKTQTATKTAAVAADNSIESLQGPRHHEITPSPTPTHTHIELQSSSHTGNEGPLMSNLSLRAAGTITSCMVRRRWVPAAWASKRRAYPISQLTQIIQSNIDGELHYNALNDTATINAEQRTSMDRVLRENLGLTALQARVLLYGTPPLPLHPDAPSPPESLDEEGEERAGDAGNRHGSSGDNTADGGDVAAKSLSKQSDRQPLHTTRVGQRRPWAWINDQLALHDRLMSETPPEAYTPPTAAGGKAQAAQANMTAMMTKKAKSMRFENDNSSNSNSDSSLSTGGQSGDAASAVPLSQLINEHRSHHECVRDGDDRFLDWGGHRVDVDDRDEKMLQPRMPCGCYLPHDSFRGTLDTSLVDRPHPFVPDSLLFESTPEGYVSTFLKPVMQGLKGSSTSTTANKVHAEPGGREVRGKKPHKHRRHSPTSSSSSSSSSSSLSSTPVQSPGPQIRLISERSRKAITRFTLEKVFPNSATALYTASLLTGRTHQIRVHFSESGLPIVGDPYYNRGFIERWVRLYQPFFSTPPATSTASSLSPSFTSLTPISGSSMLAAVGSHIRRLPKYMCLQAYFLQFPMPDTTLFERIKKQQEEKDAMVRSFITKRLASQSQAKIPSEDSALATAETGNHAADTAPSNDDISSSSSLSWSSTAAGTLDRRVLKQLRHHEFKRHQAEMHKMAQAKQQQQQHEQQTLLEQNGGNNMWVDWVKMNDNEADDYLDSLTLPDHASTASTPGAVVDVGVMNSETESPVSRRSGTKPNPYGITNVARLPPKTFSSDNANTPKVLNEVTSTSSSSLHTPNSLSTSSTSISSQQTARLWTFETPAGTPMLRVVVDVPSEWQQDMV